jgi:hypothetical protein
MRPKRTLASSILAALVLGAFVLWRTGNGPAWMYSGPLVDEVRRRTGFDLRDTAAADSPLELDNVRATRGVKPAVEFDLFNRGTVPVQFFQAWAVFRSPTGDRLRSPIYHVADATRPLRPGERRAVRLEAETPPVGGAIVAATVMTADLYCSASRRSDTYRVKPCRELIPVLGRRDSAAARARRPPR